MGNGVQGYVTHVQWGTGVKGTGMCPMGQWGHMGDRVQGTWAMGYRGMKHMANGVQGYGPQWQWGTVSNGVQGHRPHGQRGTVGNWVQGLGACGQWGTGPSNVSECQKDVKCQKIQTSRLWRRFTKTN